MTAARHHGERGQTLVELAVALPVVILLMLGLFDAGRVVIGYTTLTNAARAGARVAIVNQSNDASCGPERTFKCATAGAIVGMDIPPESVPDLVVNGSDCALSGACTVTVTVSHRVDLITPVIGSLMGPFDLSASTTMAIERLYASP